MQADLIPTKEAARRLRKGVSTISHWVTEGKLTPALKGTGPRGAMWFHVSDIDAMVAAEEARWAPDDEAAS